jgi:hypothetical protein
MLKIKSGSIGTSFTDWLEKAWLFADLLSWKDQMHTSVFFYFPQIFSFLFSSFFVMKKNMGITKLKYGKRWVNLHRKKRFTSFPSPAGMSLTKLPLGRINSVMMSLFPPRESLVHVVTSRLGTGNSRTLFLRCSIVFKPDEGDEKSLVFSKNV